MPNPNSFIPNGGEDSANRANSTDRHLGSAALNGNRAESGHDDYIKSIQAERDRFFAEYGVNNPNTASSNSVQDTQPSPSNPTISDTAPNTTPASPERVTSNAEKAAQNSAFKTYAALMLAAALGIVAGAGTFSKDKNQPNPNPVAIESVENSGDISQGEASADYESIVERSTYRGHFASEDGVTYNPNKHSNVSFGEPLKSGVSEAEMKEDLNSRMVQNAQLAATYTYILNNITDPDFDGGVVNANYDNPNDLIDAMQSDADLHQAVYNCVTGFIDNNHVEEDVVTGAFDNYFMDSAFETGDIDTSHVEIVGCTTQEDNTRVYQVNYNYLDAGGNAHVDTFIFKEVCGGQPIGYYFNFAPGLRQISDENIKKNEKVVGFVSATYSTNKPGQDTTLPDPSTDPNPPITPTPPPDDPSKNPQNTTRIDENITQGIAEDVGSGAVTVSRTPQVDPNTQTTNQTVTGATGATITHQENTTATTPVVKDPSNDFTQNTTPKPPQPVAPAPEAQAAADATPIEPAPNTVEEATNVLTELGIE